MGLQSLGKYDAGIWGGGKGLALRHCHLYKGQVRCWGWDERGGMGLASTLLLLPFLASLVSPKAVRRRMALGPGLSCRCCLSVPRIVAS